MADDSAWGSGWTQGSDAEQKRKDKKKDGKTAAPSSSGGNPWSILSYLPKLHKGTRRVKRTGAYRLKKGEAVLTIKQQKAIGFKKGGKKTPRKRVGHK